MNDFIVSIDGDLQTMALGDMPADFDFDNLVGEIIGDIDTDNPLVALKVPFRVSWRDFIWLEIFGGRQVRLNRLREEYKQIIRDLRREYERRMQARVY